MKQLLLLPALFLGACATTQSGAQQATSDERQCFAVNAITAFNYIDDQTIRIRTLSDEFYDVGLAGVCPQLSSTIEIAMISYSGNYICEGEPRPGQLQTDHRICDIDRVSYHIPDFMQ